MPDLVAYLDKKPTEYYSLGPDVLNVGQTGYNSVWRGWYSPDVGITFVQSGNYNTSNPTGYHASGSEDILAAERFSFTFDSGALMWAAINSANSINVFRYSGSSYTTQATFSGLYPAMYYNLSHNRPEYRFVHCFYLKSGQNKIYSRSSQDSFSAETIVHQNFGATVRTLNQVSRFEQHPNKMTLLGLYESADAWQLISNCFNYFETGFYLGFSGWNTGDASYLNDFECSPASNFNPQRILALENFANYPTGIVNYNFDSGIYTSGGYLWP